MCESKRFWDKEQDLKIIPTWINRNLLNLGQIILSFLAPLTLKDNESRHPPIEGSPFEHWSHPKCVPCINGYEDTQINVCVTDEFNTRVSG